MLIKEFEEYKEFEEGGRRRRVQRLEGSRFTTYLKT
jgi:hypothetical protein